MLLGTGLAGGRGGRARDADVAGHGANPELDLRVAPARGVADVEVGRDRAADGLHVDPEGEAGRVAMWTSPDTQLTRAPPPTASSSTSPETVLTAASAAVSPRRTSPETVFTVEAPPTERTATSPEADFVVS